MNCNNSNNNNIIIINNNIIIIINNNNKDNNNDDNNLYYNGAKEFDVFMCVCMFGCPKTPPRVLNLSSPHLEWVLSGLLG